MRILQISTADVSGGAERVACNLLEGFRKRGHDSWLAVGYKRTKDHDIFEIPNLDSRNAWARLCLSRDKQLKRMENRSKSKWVLRRVLAAIGDPARGVQHWLGREDFHHPGTIHIPDLPPRPPDILHAHNLHGAYFDLRQLPDLSGRFPMLMTLHDAWLFSGHCAHSFDCDRWQKGCGECPDLSIYPAVERDATARNWRVKQEIYSKSKVYVATPSRWLKERLDRSTLNAAVIESRVIPNGIDLGTFRPGDRQAARAALGLPPDAAVLLFAAAGTTQNIWKDYKTLREAVERVAAKRSLRQVVFVALGEEGPTEHVGTAQIRHIAYQQDPRDVSRYYAASDVYLHASRADTFPNVTLEAMACGVPVIATAIGGIPEQIEDARTGFLVPPGNAEVMAQRIEQTLTDKALRQRMSGTAASTVRDRFDLNRQVTEYLDWYQEIVARHGKQNHN